MTAPSTLDEGLADRLRDRLEAGPGGRSLHPIGIGRILIGPGALDRLADEVAAVSSGPIVLLEDATPMLRLGTDLKAAVEKHLGGFADVRREVLTGWDGQLHADDGTLAVARAAVEGAGCVVSVGSGTLTDIAKDACNHRGGTPLVAVQTAVSVNGFSDDMAVILRDGVKRTVPSSWVTTLLIDTEIIRDAPEAMNQAGVGELLAMFTAPADWHLAALVGLDGSYSAGVVDLFRREGDRLLTIAGGVGRRDGDALDELARLMTASGIALGVAGRTAPLSGMEHTVSHMLDMSAGHTGTPVGLHGAQVGVAAVVAAALWERMIATLSAQSLRHVVVVPSVEDLERRVKGAFSDVDPSGTMGAECWSDYAKKLDAWAGAQPSVGELSEQWDDAVSAVRRVLVSPEEMVTALHAAGAPVRFRDLDPPVDPDRARWAVANCHLMRDRFTIADLAFFTGNWNDGDVDEVLDRVADLGGGL